jgi:glycosyltransferase involved in cell wall biosynthesis
MSNDPLCHIGVCFGRLEQLHDGLGEFSLQLGTHLAARACALREQYGVQLHFRLPPARHGLFGDAVPYLAGRRWHRYPIWTKTQFAVWHGVHQFVKYVPPLRTRTRLVTIHDLNYLYGQHHPRRKARTHRKHQMLVRRSDMVVTISAHTAEDVRRHLPWAGDIKVIHNGCTDLTTMPQRRPEALRFERFFFHLSRMAPNKNPQAILGLAQHRPDWAFVLAGAKSRDTERIAAQAHERGLANVQVLESISNEEKAWLYAHCDGFLFPSLTEGFGLPPIEAMYFGCPVFLSTRTSLPEIGGTVARYFDDDFSPAEMAALIERERPAMATPQGRALTRAHAQRFTWDRCADEYVSLYLSLARSNGALSI